MSKLARVVVLGVGLAAMHLAAMTAVAQAQANQGTDAQRPPTQQQVGERWRKQPVTPQQTTTDEAVEQFRSGERASQEQTAADPALRRQLARERFSIPNPTPAAVPAPTGADEPTGQAGWLVGALAVLAAGLAVLAVLAAAKRARRRVRARPAA